MAYMDEQGCVIAVEAAEVEVGPLREGDLSEGERVNMPPEWAWIPHGPIAYTLRSDLRAKDGSIVPRGTSTLARRNDGWLVLECIDGRMIQLDGGRFCLPIPEVPRYRSRVA
jgi:hypothetical protein